MQTVPQTMPASSSAFSPASPKKGRPNPLSDAIFRQRPPLTGAPPGSGGRLSSGSGSGRGVVINGKPEDIPVRNTFVDFAPAPGSAQQKSGLVTAPATVVGHSIKDAISAAAMQRSPPPSSNGLIGTPMSGYGVTTTNYTPLQTPQSPGWQIGELPAYLRTYIPAQAAPPPAPQVAPQQLPAGVTGATQVTTVKYAYSPTGQRPAGSMIPLSTMSEGQDKDDEGSSDESEIDTNLPLDQLPSLGSASHHLGTCKRCCFFPKGRCTNGYQCDFCHFDHEKRKRKNKKKKKKAGGIDDAITSITTTTTTTSPVPAVSQAPALAPAPVAVTQAATANPPPATPTVVQTTMVIAQPTSPTAIVSQAGPLLTSAPSEPPRPAVYGTTATMTIPAPMPAPPPAPPPVHSFSVAQLQEFAPPPAPAPPPAAGPPMQPMPLPQWPAGAPMPPPQYLAPGYSPQVPLQPPPPQMPPQQLGQQPLMLPQQAPPAQAPQLQQLPPQQACPLPMALPPGYPGGMVPQYHQMDPAAVQMPFPQPMPGLLPR